ncbi:MAG: hypothetical protein HOJ97_00045 [Alphaproteobacteria bacterium]|jgi:hypothetical protein|nr:hypothetical protein [Alphaproteobacteria bacterium]
MFLARSLCKYSLLGMISLFLSGINSPKADENTNEIWNGIWFTCEFSQRTRAPDDRCKTFDNEGFRVTDGIFTYLEMINSTAENCRGNKKGHCFNSHLPEIIVRENPIGKIDIRSDHLFVRYLGCKQRFSFEKRDGFYAIIPDEKKCFWASKRHFYVARFSGDVITKK